MDRCFISCQKPNTRNTFTQWLTYPILLLFVYLPTFLFAQEVNGVFSKFAQSNDFANSWLNDVKVENNGQITVAGYYQGRPDATNERTRMPMIVRLYSNGTVNTSFGSPSGGGALVSYLNTFGETYSYGSNAIRKVQSNTGGFFILAGEYNKNNVGYIAKTTEGGSRPTAFNSGSPILPDGQGVKSYVEDMIFSGNSSFWVARYSDSVALGNYAKVVVGYYNATSGQLITSFGNGGEASLPDPPTIQGSAYNGIKMLRMGDGSIYVAYSNGAYITVCKLTSSGQLDNTFSDNGYTHFPSNLVIASLAVKVDGDVVVGGQGYNEAAQLPSTGYITFRTNDELQLVSNPAQFPLGSAMVTSTPATDDADPTLIVAGKKIVSGKPHIFIQKFNPDNDADQLTLTPWLGKNGISAIPTAIVKHYSGGYIVAGNMIGENEDTVGVVLKYNVDGTLDQNFGQNGVCYLYAIQAGQGWADAVQFADGKYLAAGTATYISDDLYKKAIVLNKFLSNGEPDSSFGDNGRLFAQLSTNTRTAVKLHAYNDGSFLVNGTYQDPSYNNTSKTAVYKFLADGSPDPSFGTNGVRFIASMDNDEFLVTDTAIYLAGGNSNSARTQVVKLSTDGNFLQNYLMGTKYFNGLGINPVSGSVFVGTGYTAHANVVSKSMVDGTIDSDFGQNGQVLLTAIPAGTSSSPCYTEQIKTNVAGIIMVVRHWYETVGLTKPQAIYFNWITPDGKVDSSVNYGTKKLLIPGATSVIPERYKWVENDSKLLIFGEAVVNGVTKGIIAKVTTSGDLDTDFGTNGVIWASNTFDYIFNFNNLGDVIKITNNGLLGGSYLYKLEIPFTVYQPISSAGWTGAISTDWFNAVNWAEGKVPDFFTKVVIASGQCIIPPNSMAYAYSVTVSPGASFTVGENSTLILTGAQP